jgi:tetratricopeptide (TPR) repeat protein/transglutaminase-like putative cysteine protease
LLHKLDSGLVIFGGHVVNRVNKFEILSWMFVGLVFLGQGYAQVAKENGATAKADYSQEALLIERYITRVNYQTDGTGTKEVTAEIRMLADAGVQRFAVLNFAYTTANEMVEFDYVRVRKPDGTVVATPDYNIQDMPADVTRSAPMYSDIHEKHVAVRALGVGDVLEYQVRYRMMKPQVPGQFWLDYDFEENAITKEELLEVTVPKDKYLKVSSPVNAPTIKEEDGKRKYTWKSSFLARKDEKEEKPKRDLPEVQISTFKTWEEVGRLYGDLQQPQLAGTPAITAKAAQLTKGLTTDEAKIRALYDYVSTQFHYIGLSFGIGRYQPHMADDVLANQYGDCKDKHTLLAALLKAAGYEAWPALMNSSRKVNPEIPSLGQFDHVITVVPRGNSLTWLDTTPQVAPYGLIMLNLRDKQALVVRTGQAPELVKTPANPPFARVETFTAEAKLGADGTLTSKMKQTLRGDSEVIFRSVFRQTARTDWKTFIQNVAYRLGFAGEVAVVEASGIDDTSKPLEFSYDYTRKNYGDWENGRIIAPFPPIGLEGLRLIEKKPTEPFELGAPGEITYKAKVELPTGRDATLLPKDANVDAPFAKFESKYLMEGNSLVITRHLVIKQHEVPVQGWEALKKFSKAVADDRDEWITLRGESAEVKSSDGEADKLYRKAYRAFQQRDLIGTMEASQKVLALDPKYQGANFLMAFAYAMQNQVSRALEYLRKEEEVSPKDERAYTMAAALLRGQKRNEESAEELRKLIKADPGNRSGSMNLSELLISEEKYREATTVLEAALRRTPESESLKMSLGRAYLKGGESEKGAALLEAAITPEAGPEVLNDAAYVLADANVRLSKAKEYAEKAVQLVEAESLSAKNDDTGMAATRSLSNSWDTLGWVYFREGDLQRALTYVEAAWQLGQHPEPGDHLGQILEKLGKTKEAAHQYELAAAAMSNAAPALANAQIRAEINKRYTKLTGKELNLNPALHRLPSGRWSMMPGEELSRARSFKVAGITGPKGSATFTMVIDRENIRETRFVTGDESMKPLAERLKQLKLNTKFPTGSKAVLMKRGLLMCASSCDFVVMLPPQNFINIQIGGPAPE